MKYRVKFIDTEVDLEAEARQLLALVEVMREKLADGEYKIGQKAVVVQNREVWVDSEQVNFDLKPTTANLLAIRQICAMMLKLMPDREL